MTAPPAAIGFLHELGRGSAGLALACALALTGCATMPPTASAPCRRRHLVIEPRLTVSLGLTGEITPVAAVTVRPACTHVAATS